MLAHGFTLEQIYNVWFPHVSATTLQGAIEKQRSFSARKLMPKPFYKHKTLLDEHLPSRRVISLLNHHFDVKHIQHDLHFASLPDPQIYELARLARTHSFYHQRQRFPPVPSGRLPWYHRYS